MAATFDAAERRRLRQSAEALRRGWQHAAHLLQASGEWRASQWAPVLKACSEDTAWQAAADLLALANVRTKPSAHMLNFALRAAAAGAMWEVALWMLAEATSANVVSFNTAALALARCAQWGQGLALLGAQRRASLQLDIISFNTFQHGLAGASWQLSVASLAFGVELRLPLDDASYSSTVMACARELQLKRALQLADEAQGMSSLNAAISAAAWARRWQLALALFQRSSHPDAVTYTSLAHAMPAEELLRSMSQQRLQPNLLTRRALQSAHRRGLRGFRAGSVRGETKGWELAWGGWYRGREAV
ncbi:unnamed protein product [Effrenium voratum]|nr:unnamed protein product [Effrenium voratum]